VSIELNEAFLGVIISKHDWGFGFEIVFRFWDVRVLNSE
jgi:hypothetical protein